MFWSPPAALPHSPLLAPTKCDRWGGNLGDPPMPSTPLVPPLPSSLSSFPSCLHTENQFEKLEASFCEEQWWIWQQLPHFLSTKLPPLFKRKRNPFVILRGGWKKTKPDWVTEWLNDWVVPHSLFPAHIHVWMCPATITQECRTKSPFSRPCTAPHFPLHSHERVISHPEEQLNSRRWHNKSFKVIASFIIEEKK